MIERFDLVDITDGHTGERYSELRHKPNGLYYKHYYIAPLIAPPWKVVCPECEDGRIYTYENGVVTGHFHCDNCIDGYIPKYYTPTEWRQWYLDNGLPDPGEWIGPVWRCGNMVHVPRWWFMPHRADPQLRVLEICAYGNVPCPPDDYRHGGE